MEMALGGPGLPPRPLVLSKGTTWGRRGCGGLLTQTPGMRHGEPGAGEGETTDDEGAPLADAGQRRPRSSFVIQPLGGEGLGRGPEAGCPLDPRSLGQAGQTENLLEEAKDA